MAWLLCLLAPAAVLGAEAESGQDKPSFGNAAATVQRQLQESLAELTRLRDQIAAEKLPLSRKLSDLEAGLADVRREHQQASRLLDTRTLDLSNLRNEIKSREEEATYLSNLLGEYVRNFESRLHIAEVQRYRDVLDAAKLAPENSNLSDEQKYEAQTVLLAESLGRLEEGLGGTRFEGTAVEASGLVKAGTFLLVGPAALFRSMDGQTVGTAEQRLGSLEPTIVAFGNPADAEMAARVVHGEDGRFPLDPTLGNAHKIESTKETLVEHIRKGGPVMYPILTMAGIALLVALYKWVRLGFLRSPVPRRMRALLNAIARHEDEAVTQEGAAVAKVRPRLIRDVLLGGALGALIGYGVHRGLQWYRPEALGFLERLDFVEPQYRIWAFVGGCGVVLGLSWHALQRVFSYSPAGEMLTLGVDHRREPRELIEEIMYEQVLATRLKVQRLLPFIAISASAAPLLGLLGTVTGIINTFKLITVFGSGDVKTLSGGISEALITTEFGLIVAIPSLLLYAFLSRRARGVISEMEKAAVALANQISKSPYAETGGTGDVDGRPADREPDPDEPPEEPQTPVRDPGADADGDAGPIDAGFGDDADESMADEPGYVELGTGEALNRE